MNRIFVDTSALFFFFDEKAPQREKIMRAFETALAKGFQLVTTDYILDELFTIVRCREKLPVTDILRFFDNVNISDIKVLGITQELFQESLFMMGKFSDQYLSFTDCVSFTVMKEIGIKDFIGMDKHFETAGFNNLLRS
jgi:predicted nucleic acid-binding protein